MEIFLTDVREKADRGKKESRLNKASRLNKTMKGWMRRGGRAREELPTKKGSPG